VDVFAARLAVGAAYTYSFPGLLWLLGTAVIWGIAELVLTRRRSIGDLVRSVGPG